MRQLKNFMPTKPADFDKYSSLEENELMEKLIANVAQSKSNGTFSAEQLDEFVGFVESSLDEAAVKRLRDLVAMIKNT